MHAGIDMHELRAALARRGLALPEGQVWRGGAASYVVRLPCGHPVPLVWSVVKGLRRDHYPVPVCHPCRRVDEAIAAAAGTRSPGQR